MSVDDLRPVAQGLGRRGLQIRSRRGIRRIDGDPGTAAFGEFGHEARATGTTVEDVSGQSLLVQIEHGSVLGIRARRHQHAARVIRTAITEQESPPEPVRCRRVAASVREPAVVVTRSFR